MIPFWWACCTAWQTGMASSSRSRRRQPALVAEPGDRDALDQLHHEVGAAGVGRAGVEDLGDVGMVHQGQRLPLGLEAGEDLAAVHAGLDELERDRPPHRLGLLGHVDRAHAPFADRLEQLVRADDSCPRSPSCRSARSAARRRGLAVAESPPSRPSGFSRKLPRCRVGAEQGSTSARSSASPPQASFEEGLPSLGTSILPRARDEEALGIVMRRSPWLAPQFSSYQCGKRPAASDHSGIENDSRGAESLDRRQSGDGARPWRRPRGDRRLHARSRERRGLFDREAGEEAELDQLAALTGRPRRARSSASSSANSSSTGSSVATCDGRRAAMPLAIATPLLRCLRRAFSTGCGASPRRRRRRSGRGYSSLARLRLDQTEIGLVDQGRGLECLPRLLLGQLLRGQPAQLVVDQREELLGGRWVALFDRRKDPGYFGHGTALIPRRPLAPRSLPKPRAPLPRLKLDMTATSVRMTGLQGKP